MTARKMKRAGGYLRRESRAKRLAVFKKNKLLFTAYPAAMVAIMAASTLLLPNWLTWFLMGGTCSAVVAMFLHLLSVAAGDHNELLGAWGEEATWGTLKRLRRSGNTIIHNVCLENSDIDHVVIGPAGVLVIESKWTNHAWACSGDQLVVPVWARDPMRQIERNAWRIGRWLFHRSGVEVRPVIVVWGPGSRLLPAEKQLKGGITLLSSPSHETWRKLLDSFAGPRLNPDEIVRAATEIRTVVSRRVAGSGFKGRPRPASVGLTSLDA